MGKAPCCYKPAMANNYVSYSISHGSTLGSGIKWTLLINWLMENSWLLSMISTRHQTIVPVQVLNTELSWRGGVVVVQVYIFFNNYKIAPYSIDIQHVLKLYQWWMNDQWILEKMYWSFSQKLPFGIAFHVSSFVLERPYQRVCAWRILRWMTHALCLFCSLIGLPLNEEIQTWYYRLCKIFIVCLTLG